MWKIQDVERKKDSELRHLLDEIRETPDATSESGNTKTLVGYDSPREFAFGILSSTHLCFSN